MTGPIFQAQLDEALSDQSLDVGYFVASWQVANRLIRGLFTLLGFYLIICGMPKALREVGSDLTPEDEKFVEVAS